MQQLAAVLASLLALSSAVYAAPRVTLRFATAAPDGTAWARALKAMARDIEDESHGAIATKFYFGGIAGDELDMFARLERGQLDVIMSGGMLCTRLSPSMRVLRLLGLFQSREESAYVLGRMRSIIDAEFAEHGLHTMATAGLGSDMVFSRTPITTFDELRKTKIWMWSLDETMFAELRALGVSVVPLPLNDAGRAYDKGQIDGFLAVPAAALAFQWSAQSKYLSGLKLAYLPACMMMSNRAWDQLTVEERKQIIAATAKGQARIEEVGRSQDDELLNRLFARQGVKIIKPSVTFSSEFFQAAARVREELRDKLVPGPLLQKVTGWVADFRAEYGRPRK